MTWHAGPSVSMRTIEFAQKAHAHFVAHPDVHSFTVDDLSSGELIALRWAFDKSKPETVWSVLVFEIGSTPVLVEDL